MVVHQAEALPGPSLDQWHRSAGEDNDGPGTVQASMWWEEGPLSGSDTSSIFPSSPDRRAEVSYPGHEAHDKGGVGRSTERYSKGGGPRDRPYKVWYRRHSQPALPSAQC